MSDQEAPRPLGADELDAVGTVIERWLESQRHENPAVLAVEEGEPGERRWYVRLAGEEKDVFTIWLTLGQRTLRYETYVLPAPEENHADFYAHLLQRNADLYGWSFEIGDEAAIFLAGRIDADQVDDATLDRILGSGWTYVERCFRSALRIGFASRWRRNQDQ